MPAPKRYERYRGKRVAAPRGRPISRDGSRPSPGGGERQPEKVKAIQRRERRRLWRLGISASILVAAVALKILSPQTVSAYRDQMLVWMGEDTNFVAAFSAVGRAVGAEGKLGDVLNDAYVAVFGENLAPENGGSEPPATERSIYTPENLPQQADLLQHRLGFTYASPLVGAVTDRFGYRDHPVDGEEKFHYGVDIDGKNGAVISSFADGKITVIGESSDLGKYVTVLHENGYTTLYAHCSRITASTGQLVKLGDPIAEVGQSGNATGPHLHFELHADTVYLNPIYYISEDQPS